MYLCVTRTHSFTHFPRSANEGRRTVVRCVSVYLEVCRSEEAHDGLSKVLGGHRPPSVKTFVVRSESTKDGAPGPDEWNHLDGLRPPQNKGRPRGRV